MEVIFVSETFTTTILRKNNTFINIKVRGSIRKNFLLLFLFESQLARNNYKCEITSGALIFNILL